MDIAATDNPAPPAHAVPAAGRVAARLFGPPGRSALRFVADAGRLAIFAGTSVARLFHRPARPSSWSCRSSSSAPARSAWCCCRRIFTGLVLALQGYNALVRFGSENLVGSLVALSLTRELAPVLTALMVTARAGSAMTATIGNMAVTEQIDALESLAVDPLSYLVAAAPAGDGRGAAAA